MRMRGVLALCGWGMLSFAAVAQETPAEPEKKGPDPVRVLKAADEAVQKLEHFSYKASSRGVGSKSTRSPEVDATVRAVRLKKDPLGFKFLARGTSHRAGQETRDFAVAYDGKTVRSVREWEKKVLEGSAAASEEPMGDGAGWAMTWLLRWDDMVHAPFGGEEPQGLCRYEGVVNVGTEPCDVIYVDYSDSPDPTLFDAWWYLSREDHLPRKLERRFVESTFGDGFLVLTITDLETSSAVGDEQLALAAPEGFEVVKAKEAKPEPGGRAVAVAGVPVGDIAPDFTLKDPSGKEHKLSEYRGKIVVLDFWATWCGPCQMAMPGIQAVHEKFKGKGVEVFGVNCWESADPAAFMKDKGFTYGLLLKGDDVAKDYRVSGIPTFYVVGPDGRIIYSAIGADPSLEETLGNLIEARLAP
jgi:thiol-disulfide isomerase/thioredoxin